MTRNNLAHVYQATRHLIPADSKSHCCDTAHLLEWVGIFRTHRIQKNYVLDVVLNDSPYFVSHFTWVHSLEIWKFEVLVLFSPVTRHFHLNVITICTPAILNANLREKSRLVFEVFMVEKQLYCWGRSNCNSYLKINKKTHLFTVAIIFVHIMIDRINISRVFFFLRLSQ